MPSLVPLALAVAAVGALTVAANVFGVLGFIGFLLPPVESLFDQRNAFLHALLGLMSIAGRVRDISRVDLEAALDDVDVDVDDFALALLGIVAVGDKLERGISPGTPAVADAALVREHARPTRLTR